MNKSGGSGGSAECVEAGGAGGTAENGKIERLPRRPMKFPYTFAAKIAQFPLKFYIKNQWIWRYYFISLLVSLPIFYKIHKLANSEENVAKWNEKKAKEHEDEHHHE